MTILNKLATALNRRDEVPNQELAIVVAEKNDKNAVKELIENLNNKSKDIQNDCIKVLYEIGERKPVMLSPYVNEFIALLKSKNNRMQWGVMAALNTITLENPQLIYANLTKIVEAMDKGTVITKDNGVNILIKLCSLKQYSNNAFSLLIEQLRNGLTNQLAMYAERAMPAVNDKNKTLFIKTLNARFRDLEKDSQRKRIEKVIMKLGGK